MWTALALVLLGATIVMGCTPAADGGIEVIRLSPSESLDDGQEQAVIDAYLAYWDAFLAAHDPPNEHHPALKDHATGKALESVTEGAMTMRLARRATRVAEGAAYRHDVTVMHVGRSTATVRDCTVDDLIVVNMDTGEVVNDEVETILGRAELVREDGQWKVANTTIERTWEGIAGCAVE